MTADLPTICPVLKLLREARSIQPATLPDEPNDTPAALLQRQIGRRPHAAADDAAHPPAFLS
ncbi:MAG: hypothetical protein JNJ46_30295 [Myxococcales bacterium]|nr:hypothetical protein [Myxococcales bacterium]